MTRIERLIGALGEKLNFAACAAILIMMMITCADVILRFFGRPIVGAYELVGLSGTVVASFALAYTSLERGHIAVELLVARLPKRVQFLIDGINSLLGVAIFSLLAWQSFAYANDLRVSGEVSLTLQIPTYPFVYSISVGCGMLCLVLLADGVKSIRRTVRK